MRSDFSVKIKAKDTMGLDYSLVCNIGSRVVWVSMKVIYYQVLIVCLVVMGGVEGYLLTTYNVAVI